MSDYVTKLQDKEHNGLLPRTVLKAIADDNGDYINNTVTADDINAISLLRGLVIKEMGTGYIQFENGFQICWGRETTANTTGTVGAETIHGSVNFAKAFTVAPVVIMQAKNYAGTYYSIGVTPYSTYFTFAVKVNHAFQTAGTEQDWIAIGNWK